MVVTLAEKMANRALVAMRDTRRAIADKLTSQGGINAIGASATMHQHTIGAHVMNDHVESHFGSYDFLSRTFRYSVAENISGMVQQSYNHDFERRPNVAHDRHAMPFPRAIQILHAIRLFVPRVCCSYWLLLTSSCLV